MDNRVEAPTWAPDGGSDKAEDQQSEGESAATPDTEGTESVITPSDRTDSPASAESDEAAATEDPGRGRTVPRRRLTPRTVGAGEQHAAGADADDPWSPSAASSTPSAAANGAPRAWQWRYPATFADGPSGRTGRGRQHDHAAGLCRWRGARPGGEGLGAVLRAQQAQGKPRRRSKASRPEAAPPRPQGVRPQPRLTPSRSNSPQTRQAQLKLDRIEPWSVMKFRLPDLAGRLGHPADRGLAAVLHAVQARRLPQHRAHRRPGDDQQEQAWLQRGQLVPASRVLGFLMLVGAVNVILLTALATIGAVLYNLVTMLAGGIEVTLGIRLSS